MFAFRADRNFVSNVKALFQKCLFPVTSFHCSNLSNVQNRSVKNLSYVMQNRNFEVVGLRKLVRHASALTQSNLYASELEEFNTVGKIIHNDLTECDNKAISDAANWCSKVFEYNLKHGKKNRGTAVLKSYRTLSTDTGSDGLLSACILGWCVELMQAFFLISDDIMDQSTTRRGELCWYKKPEVGFEAVNDAYMLQCGIYKILRKHFQNCDFYINVVHEFLQVTEKTVYGQCLDMLCNPLHGKPNYENFTKEKYQAITEHKTSHYTYCLPVHLAMHLVGNRTLEEFRITKELCLKIGLLFQIQDDYLDCYGDPKITGKLGTDIMQGKCSWLAVTFLEHANDIQRKEWMKSYGMADEESVSKIKLLYEKLNLLDKYLKCEHELYTDIKISITNELADKSMQELFSYLLDKTFKREK